MQPGDNKGLSLFMRMLIAFIAVVILVSGTLTWASYVFNRRSIEQHTAENILQQFRAIEYHFGYESRVDMVKDLRILASNPVLDDFIMSSPVEREVGARAVERLFLGAMKYHESFEGVYFVDTLGMEQVRVDRSGRVKTYRNLSAHRLFTRIKNGTPGGVDLVGPWKNSAGRVVASIGIHKVDQDIGKFGGALVIDWSLDGFIDYLGKIKIFDENLIWFFFRDGTLLMRPRTTGEALDPRPYLSKDVQSEPRLLLVKEGMVVYQDLSVLPGKPLARLAIGIPLSLLLKDIQSTLKFFMLVFLLALFIASIIAFYLSRYLSKPITVLADAASRLAKGDLSAQVEIRASGEVRRLVDSFNRMSEDLEKTTVSKNYVNDILASMRDTLLVASTDGKITRINMAASFLLGYDETELVGEQLSWVVLDEPGAVKPTLDMILENSSISSVEKTYLDRNGKMIPMLFSASVMRESDGQVHGVVCVAQNITERKKAEEKLHTYSEELQEINEELKNFAYIVSHDLRAPLVNIKGFSDELIHSIAALGPSLEKYLDSLPQAEREKFRDVLKKDIPEALAFIGSSVSRMDSLINAILQLSRAGRRELSPEPVSIQDLIGTIVNSLTHQLGLKNATVTLQEDLPDVIADRTALGQIFGNLLDNAVKYLEPGRAGSIEVSVAREDGEVVFHVRDNGRGMAQEDIPRAFEIFRRVGRQDVPGEGMGLAYVKTLVRHQGGRIWCESEPGKGTTFSFTLPQAGKAKGAD